ncbi:hypothetical protein HPB50_018615 [Hyalomma asiaticum]|uniref:Uncharacterized protein n=1 Tax=Hyalomma asiaticum TaxID=266040 RepID=A0ACB7SH17_HYAAI|nr:hypothetical protein HPB50_018615 [Hyalomma asiaticum]
MLNIDPGLYLRPPGTVSPQSSHPHDGHNGPTRAVTSLWEEHLTDLRRAKRNIKIYAAIAEKLQALGCDKKKIENLGNKYRSMKRMQTGTGSGAISWPHYWDIHREPFRSSLAASARVPEEVQILEGIVRGEVADHQPPSEGCLSPLPVAAPEPPCTPRAGTCPHVVDNSASSETESTPSSCEEPTKRSQKTKTAACAIYAYCAAAGRTEAASSLSRRKTRERTGTKRAAATDI